MKPTQAPPARSGQSEGPATDRHNQPVVDPTKNVLELVAAANQRQDDLRQATKELSDAKLAHQKEISDLRAKHYTELRIEEKERLNSIRQVDREDVNKAATSAQTAITTLAQQAATTAETLRTQVATTAQAQLTTFQTAMAEVVKRISALELSSSEGKGKQAVSDPAMTQLVEEVRHLATIRDATEGKSSGVSMIVAIIMGAALFIATMLSIGLALFALMKPVPIQPVAVPIVTPAR